MGGSCIFVCINICNTCRPRLSQLDSMAPRTEEKKVNVILLDNRQSYIIIYIFFGAPPSNSSMKNKTVIKTIVPYSLLRFRISPNKTIFLCFILFKY